MKTLKTQTANALAYCQNLLSFVFQNKEAADKIDTVYLFGSAVRGELQKNSDIDLFFSCPRQQEGRVKMLVDSGIVRFSSSQDYQKWKLLKFTYAFSIQAGDLKEWDLHRSIASEGLLLYGKKVALQGQRYVLFTISYPLKKSKYVALRRRLFGRDEPDYVPSGAVQQLGGKKLSAHVFMLPKEEQSSMMELLGKEQVSFSMKEVILLES